MKKNSYALRIFLGLCGVFHGTGATGSEEPDIQSPQLVTQSPRTIGKIVREHIERIGEMTRKINQLEQLEEKLEEKLNQQKEENSIALQSALEDQERKIKELKAELEKELNKQKRRNSIVLQSALQDQEKKINQKFITVQSILRDKEQVIQNKMDRLESEIQECCREKSIQWTKDEDSQFEEDVNTTSQQIRNQSESREQSIKEFDPELRPSDQVSSKLFDSMSYIDELSDNKENEEKSQRSQSNSNFTFRGMEEAPKKNDSSLLKSSAIDDHLSEDQRKSGSHSLMDSSFSLRDSVEEEDPEESSYFGDANIMPRLLDSKDSDKLYVDNKDEDKSNFTFGDMEAAPKKNHSSLLKSSEIDEDVLKNFLEEDPEENDSSTVKTREIDDHLLENQRKRGSNSLMDNDFSLRDSVEEEASEESSKLRSDGILNLEDSGDPSLSKHPSAKIESSDNKNTEEQINSVEYKKKRL